MEVTTRPATAGDWRTKPSDRFVLRWIKLHLSAPVTRAVQSLPWVRPWMLTIVSAGLATCGGVFYSLGMAWQAGLLAAAAQVLDGVDGQLARRGGWSSRGGAFLDSVLDRYGDGALVIGLGLYLTGRAPEWVPGAAVPVLGALALIGSGLISYTTARADALGIDLGPPTLASKGTRTTVIVVCAWLAAVGPAFPLASLVYLAGHTQVEVVRRLRRAAGEV